jgi:putative FmdB family regulatory protein
MPVYEYYCDKCDREVAFALTISQREKGQVKCPKCLGGRIGRPRRSFPEWQFDAAPSH